MTRRKKSLVSEKPFAYLGRIEQPGLSEIGSFENFSTNQVFLRGAGRASRQRPADVA
jgi:hypothetical protein